MDLILDVNIQIYPVDLGKMLLWYKNLFIKSINTSWILRLSFWEITHVGIFFFYPFQLYWFLVHLFNKRQAIDFIQFALPCLILLGDKFRLVIASTLYEDGTPDDGEYNPQDDRPSR